MSASHDQEDWELLADDVMVLRMTTTKEKKYTTTRDKNKKHQSSRL
jgi:hypothetical protein